MDTDRSPDPVPDRDPEIDLPPSVRHRVKSAISVAWLTDHADARLMVTFRDAWEPLAAQAAWREWSAEHLQPLDAVLILSVRDDLPRRRFIKTRRGVSAHLPFAEIADHDACGDLEDFCRHVIRDIYVRWADTRSLPHPPPLLGG